MSASMLELIQRATGEMGLPVPTYVAGNTAQDTIQQLALLNAVGNELTREFPWEVLNTEYRFTTQFLSATGDTTANSAVLTALSSTTGLDSTYMVTGNYINQDTYVSTVDSLTQVTLTQAATGSATGQTMTFSKVKYDMPSDFDRLIDRTDWDKSKHWEMLGPETPQQWQWLKSGYISTGPRIRYRVMGGYFQIWPPMGTAEYLGFEYVSNGWAFSSGTAVSQMTADDDTCIFPDVLMVLGLKRKYFEIKGFDTSAFERDYQTQLNIAKANDAGSPTLSLAPRPTSVLIGWENIPDSGLGS